MSDRVEFEELGRGVRGIDLSRPQGEPVDTVDLIVAADHTLDGEAHRVQVWVHPQDREGVRIAHRAGFRREGLLRGVAGPGPAGDRFVAARLAQDPPRTSREGRLAMLNASLPTKRVIAQGVIRDDQGRVLLCELTYKTEWDLPGGVVDPGEGPFDTVAREVREELGVDVPVGPLLSVNWLPPYRSWSDALLCVFDLGVHSDLPSRATLQPTEIAELHWCTPDEVAAHAAPYVARHLERVWNGAQTTDATVYLSGGEPVA